MPLLNESMSRCAMPDEVETFLDSILQKMACGQTDRQGCDAIKLDELYGVLPETHAIRHGRETADRNLRATIVTWNLSEILTLKNRWDDLNATLWRQDGRWYCMKLKLFQKEWSVPTEPAINHPAAEEIFPVISRRLTLLASAFGNTPLRQLGVRRYVHDFMMRSGDKSKRDFLLEFFLTLFHLELTGEELDNQDIFLKRAALHCKSIIAMRSRCSVKPEAMKMAGAAAARGIGTLLDEFFVPMNMIWGFLANRKALDNFSIPVHGKFCFHEYYDAAGKIELGEIIPVTDRAESGFESQRNRDCYTQVFPDYQTALTFRNVALALLHPSNHGREA